MSNKSVVILGAGGAVAGTSNSASDIRDCTAAQLSIRASVRDIPALEAMGHIVVEQVAQIDITRMHLLRCGLILLKE